jgi:hypothetical protein
MEAITLEIVLGLLSILGPVILLVLQKFFPKYMPVIGKIKKTSDQLLMLHHQRVDKNSNIAVVAQDFGYDEAVDEILKLIDKNGERA